MSDIPLYVNKLKKKKKKNDTTEFSLNKPFRVYAYPGKFFQVDKEIKLCFYSH